MTTKYFALLTNQGAAKLANAAALGTKVNIASMGVGDGGGTLPTPDAAQTKLIGEKRRAQLNSLTIDAANSSQIIAEQIIPESEGGFWIREIGLYDADGVLIAVANCPETYKPQLAEGSGRTQTVRMILIVNSTTAVTLKIDPSVVLATRKYVDDAVIEVKAYADGVMKKHIDADNPHSQYLQIANALAEIKDAGLIADVLKNLGLGDAAKKTVGNGAGQLPDMSFFSIVKSGNGYCKFPNGLILQWGFGSYAQQSTTTVTLPVAFPTGGFTVVANKGSSIPLRGEYCVGVQFRDKSSFSLSNTGPDTTQQGVWWMAIGH
ncbi:phage tail protein [Pantoea agglomerans]|uniref:phage tail protein n=1 Tax=Enterobacter agglomerans TaxID=549 RepID=UPI00289CFA27|nr:phage tail protein [Pantoea agglomerans]WNK67581.1 phage tail protein [Pantoea agglomerans]